MKALLYKGMRRLSITWVICIVGYGLLISGGLLRDFQWSLSDTDSLLSPALFFFFSVLCAYDIFRIEQLSGWDKYVNALPFSPEEIVGSKYILAIISTAIYQAVIIFFGLADCLITRKDFPAHIFIMAAGVLIISSLVNAVYIPIAYTVNYLSSYCIIISIDLIIYFSVFAIFSNIMSKTSIQYLQSFPYSYSDDMIVYSTYWTCLLLSIVFLGISYYISLKKFRTRDF